MLSNLKECEVGVADVIEGDLWVDPGVVLQLALELVVNHLHRKAISGLVDALVKFPAKKLDAHDWENQPKI